MADPNAEQTTQAVTDLAEDLFSSGFDEIVNPPSEEVKPETATTEKPTEPAATEPEPAAAPAEAVPEVPEPQKPESPDLKTVIAEVIAATRPEPVKEAPVAVEPPAPAALSSEEIAAEEQFRKDWPEHAAREDRLKADITQLKTMLESAVGALRGQLAPVVESVTESAQQRHLSEITNVHKDALEIVPDVEKWIETQPEILRPTYMAVLDRGTSKAIIELYNLYRKDNPKPAETPVVASDPAVVAAAADAKKAAEASKQATADRLNRMEAPPTVRTSVTAEEDADDFESGFDSEAKKIAVGQQTW